MRLFAFLLAVVLLPATACSRHAAHTSVGAGASEGVGVEVCDGVDNDGDREIDDHAGQVFFVDRDGDGHGSDAAMVVACEAPAGWVASDADCDDRDPAVHPGAPEVCDGHDNDCDGATDDADLDAIGQHTWYRDDSGDGLGDATRSVASCAAPEGFVAHAMEVSQALALGGAAPGEEWGTG